jgi:hypothetical protein
MRVMISMNFILDRRTNAWTESCVDSAALSLYLSSLSL